VPTTGTDYSVCHWVCVVGNQWVCDGNCTCPEEENCVPPARAGFSGEREQTPCVPIA
jgi:hypothetical protein